MEVEWINGGVDEWRGGWMDEWTGYRQMVVCVCTGCGETTYCLVREYNPNAWRKKSQFRCGTIKVNRLIRTNVSRHDFYIMRICSRPGIPIKGTVRDLKPGKANDRYEYNLYGVVHKDLGWNINRDKASKNDSTHRTCWTHVFI